MNSRHLDLGSGSNPRNPYFKDEVFGIDIIDIQSDSDKFHYKKANLVTQRIPFQDSYFDSVSAFDFLEHVPRIRIHDNGITTFPFILLMDEIYRVLKNNGMFYAVTPFYPNISAFQDPTHVNIITRNTHEYFCGEYCYAKNYGFIGNYKLVRSYPLSVKLAKKGANHSFFDRLYDLKRKMQGRHTHLLWELQAVK